MKTYTIVSIASEVAPFSKTGGLGDVTRSLPKSLKRLGNDSIVITPLYKKLIAASKLQLVFSDIALGISKKDDPVVSYYRGELMRGLPIYFISCDRYFGRKKMIYGSSHENRRFYIFDVAALKLIELLKKKPDIIHCHDWHAGLIPELLKKNFKQSDYLGLAATVFTIHNLAYQLGHDWWEIPGQKRDRGIDALPELYDDRHMERVNFTKRAILNSDVINAVSETYAEEILDAKWGQDLHRILQNRKERLFGIVNGIDYKEFNPARDPKLSMNYTYAKVHRKKMNKLALQKHYGLGANPDQFLIVMTSRIAEQKGFDILLPVIPALMKLHIQLLIMGDGDKEYIKSLSKLTKQFPKQMVVAPFSEKEFGETMLYAGGDISLFPSRFEPCGINQLKSLRYGCVPIAREIGGLSDTISDFDLHANHGNGFVFAGYNTHEFLSAITRAYSHYQHHADWRTLVVRGMKQSNSWELPARKYMELYKKALKNKQ